MIDFEQELMILKIYLKRLEKITSMSLEALKEIKEGIGIPKKRASATLQEAERMMNETKDQAERFSKKT